MRRAAYHPETNVAREVKDLCRRMGCEVYDTRDVRAKRGATSGIPDFLVFCPRKGAFWFMELKTEDGKLSEAQREFESLSILSAIPYVCGGVDAALAHLKEIGVVTT